MSKEKKPRTKKRGAKRVLLTILLVVLILCVVAGLGATAYVLSLARELPDITVEDLITAQTSFVYDENGQQIAVLHGGEDRISVDLDEMPQYLIDAVIASEDIRFYKHNGFDLRGAFRALVVDIVDSIKAGSVTFTQGASTITMQLVKNVVGDTEKTIPRKIKEILLAIEFEKKYDKDEILYYYMNEIYLGANVYGVQSGSMYYFNKDVSELTMAEAATLVAVLRAPAYYSPYDNPELVISVRNAILDNMMEYKPDVYTQDMIAAAQAEELVVSQGESSTASYDNPWFVDYVVSEAIDLVEDMGYDSSYVYTGGLSIYTTMDPVVQNAIETVYADADNFPSSSTGDIIESAMAIVEPTTGQIKGLVGGREYSTRRGFNRATDLLRQPGSTIKPLVAYGPAIELGYGAGTVIDDSPLASGNFQPNNDDYTYMGRITMRTAVMRSRNLCAVKVLDAIGVETGYEYGLKLGLPLVSSDVGLSLALGGLSYGASPLDMASAFATFANDGVYIEPYCITKITDSKGNVLYTAETQYTEVFSAATSYVMTDILCSAVNGGTGTNAKISGWQTAGKTGTNGLPQEDPDYAGKSGTKDAWFCGYTTALSGAVWIGYDDKWDDNGNLQYLSNIYGSSYPARIFNKVMTLALQNYENKNFSRPDGVYSVTLDTKTGKAPTELTPDGYTATDIFSTSEYIGFIGDEVEWATVSICPDTNKLAGMFCFNYDNKVMLRYTSGTSPYEGASESVLSKVQKVGDIALYAPTEYCTPAGNTDGENPGNGTSVYICTDPRHDGEAVLANVASNGYTGGCDPDYVVLRYFDYKDLPVMYCSLSDHQLSVDGSSSGSGKPLTPTNLMAYATESGIMVSWSTSETGVSFVLERYDVSSGESDRKLLSESSYLDTDVVYGQSYSYRVYAYNRSTQKTSDWTTQVSATY